MKHLILLFLFFCSVSCSSNAQEQPVPTSSADTIPAQKITLLFAGDLMQHQAQIDAARTATGYDYTDYFKTDKRRNRQSRHRHRKSGGNPRWKALSGVSGLQCSRRISDRNQRCRLQRIDNSQQSLPRPRQKRVGKNHPDVGFPTNSVCRHLHR